MKPSVIRFPAVKSRCGISHSNIYHQINQGTFPKPIKLGMRAVGWLETDIDEWLSRKIEESQQGPSKKAVKGKLSVASSNDCTMCDATPIVPDLLGKELK